MLLRASFSKEGREGWSGYQQSGIFSPSFAYTGVLFPLCHPGEWHSGESGLTPALTPGAWGLLRVSGPFGDFRVQLFVLHVADDVPNRFGYCWGKVALVGLPVLVDGHHGHEVGSVAFLRLGDGLARNPLEAGDLGLVVGF